MFNAFVNLECISENGCDMRKFGGLNHTTSAREFSSNSVGRDLFET